MRWNQQSFMGAPRRSGAAGASISQKTDRSVNRRLACGAATYNAHAKSEQGDGRMIEGLFSIEGKTALVTGGSSGIGAMIARGYVEAGARVYIASRKADVCEAVAKELSAFGTCIALPHDLGTTQGA